MKIRVFIIPAVLLIMALATGFILLFSLFVLSALTLLICYLWTVIGIRGITGHVEDVSGHSQVGEWFGEKTTVVNNSWVPKVHVKVQEHTDMPGHQNTSLFNMSPRRSHSWETDVYCARRGKYSLGSLTATISDPFGIFSSSRNFGEPQSLFVYPAILELPFFQILSRNDLGHGSSRWLTSESGPGAARVREYIVGDTLNRIHWRSTAHARKLMIKEFDTDHSNYSTKNIWIVLDMNHDSHVYTDVESTEEYCITIATSLIKKYIDNDKEVGLLVSDEPTEIFPPKIGNQHFWDMVSVLTLIKATGETTIDQSLLNNIELFGDNPVVIVITPVANDKLAAALRKIRSRGAVIVAIISNLDESASAARSASNLISSGFQVYSIRHGDKLHETLDSRAYIPSVRSARDIV
ncbi:DUF58 domain-containing protein [Chloroflexota bacterium]